MDSLIIPVEAVGGHHGLETSDGRHTEADRQAEAVQEEGQTMDSLIILPLVIGTIGAFAVEKLAHLVSISRKNIVGYLEQLSRLTKARQSAIMIFAMWRNSAVFREETVIQCRDAK